jgi:hypothetical protein
MQAMPKGRLSASAAAATIAARSAWRDVGWITCEETTNGVNQGFDKPHGYNFLVPARADATVAAIPFKAMGRFSHEA